MKQSGEHSKEETRLRTFSYEELNKATDNFSPNRIIGKGGSGVVYRGILRGSGNIVAQGGSNGRGGTTVDVAVKMIIGPSVYEEADYIAEIQVIGRLQHPNVVRLLGWCVYGKQLLLVHEFMPNGGLDSHLYKPELPHLPWEMRYSRVVAGLASALDYLQNGWVRCVVHRDIKPSNILLDSEFNPKLTDFDLARLADDHDSELDITNVVAGTRGYLAPEFVIRGKFSKESDIYAFGVVLLEIACGRKPFNQTKVPSNCERRSLINWVRDLVVEGRIHEAADPRLDDAFNAEEMERLLRVGLMCTSDDADKRISIQRIREILNRRESFAKVVDIRESISHRGPPGGMMDYFLADSEQSTVCFELDRPADSTHADMISSEANHIESQSDHALQEPDQDSCWDIGIPPDYSSAQVSPMKDHHRPVVNGFVAGLQKLLQSEDEPLQFDEVLKDIRMYTACLVSVGAPLVEWNSLAQLLLRVSQMMNAFPDLITPRPMTAATFSSLRACIGECTHAGDDHETRSKDLEEQLIRDRNDKLLLMTRLAKLEKQIKEAEIELKSVNRTTAQHRELQGKLSTILNQYQLALSKLSSFTFM